MKFKAVLKAHYRGFRQSVSMMKMVAQLTGIGVLLVLASPIVFFSEWREGYRRAMRNW